MRGYGRDYRRYDSRFWRTEPRRDRRFAVEYDRGYTHGWGMSGLYNTIIERGPGGRYAAEYGGQAYRRRGRTGAERYPDEPRRAAQRYDRGWR